MESITFTHNLGFCFLLLFCGSTRIFTSTEKRQGKIEKLGEWKKTTFRRFLSIYFIEKYLKIEYTKRGKRIANCSHSPCAVDVSRCARLVIPFRLLGWTRMEPKGQCVVFSQIRKDLSDEIFFSWNSLVPLAVRGMVDRTLIQCGLPGKLRVASRLQQYH